MLRKLVVTAKYSALSSEWNHFTSFLLLFSTSFAKWKHCSTISVLWHSEQSLTHHCGTAVNVTWIVNLLNNNSVCNSPQISAWAVTFSLVLKELSSGRPCGFSRYQTCCAWLEVYAIEGRIPYFRDYIYFLITGLLTCTGCRCRSLSEVK